MREKIHSVTSIILYSILCLEAFTIGNMVENTSLAVQRLFHTLPSISQCHQLACIDFMIIMVLLQILQTAQAM